MQSVCEIAKCGNPQGGPECWIETNMDTGIRTRIYICKPHIEMLQWSSDWYTIKYKEDGITPQLVAKPQLN